MSEAESPRATALGLFAKHWTPGQVKTRLARHLGIQAAARVHRLFVECLLDRLAPGGQWHGFLVCWPPERYEPMAHLAVRCGWRAEAQCPGDLGRKMHHFVQRRFGQGYRRVLLLGADAPDVPLAFLERACRVLHACEVVLGPCPDGGYYLLGLGRDVPQLFYDIAWGTPQVWQQSVDRLEQAGISWSALPPWPDVDHWEDLCALRKRLRQSDSEALRRLEQALRAIP